MNMQQTLANLDKVLGTPASMKVVKMTQEQFQAYVASEVEKAKKDAEDEDTAKGAAKAKKRLEHLRAVTKLLIEKGSWEGTNATPAIPVYEEGFEPPTYMPTEQKTGTPPTIGGTAGDGKSVFENGFTAPPLNMTAAPGGGPSMTGGTGTQADATIFANGPVGKALGDLAETLKGLEKTPAKKADETPADEYVWPRDCADASFLKEGVAKRAEEWGIDTTKSPK